MNATPYQFVSTYLRFAREMFRRTAAGEYVRYQWAGDYLDAAAWRREFVTALHRRINAKGGVTVYCRKADNDYHIRLWRDSRRVRELLTTRIIHRQFETVDARRRFGHLLTENNNSV